MSNNLRLQVVLDVLDRATAPLRGVAAQAQRMSGQLNASRGRLRQLEQSPSA